MTSEDLDVASGDVADVLVNDKDDEEEEEEADGGVEVPEVVEVVEVQKGTVLVYLSRLGRRQLKSSNLSNKSKITSLFTTEVAKNNNKILTLFEKIATFRKI